MNHEIRLSLKKLWFTLIKTGKKNEEYREIKPYYCARLCANYDKNSEFCKNCKNNFCRPSLKSTIIHFTLGYPTDLETEKHFICNALEVIKGYGKPLLGAPRHKVFIIKLKH